MRTGLAVVVLALTIGTVGCERLRSSPEDRINAAYPLAESAAKSQTALLQLIGDQRRAERDALEAEVASRLKIRALTCGKGASPSFASSPESIRKQIGNPTCFPEQDEALTAWLNHRRIGELLAAPPLRPVPRDPPTFIAASNRIGMPWFAARAGVGLFSSHNGVEIMDLNTSRPIFVEREESSRGSTRLSANGRLFVGGGAAGLRIRATETGEVLATYPDLIGLNWLDEQTAIASEKEGVLEAVLIDFTNGTTVPLRGVTDRMIGLLPTSTAGEFVLLTHRDLVRFAIDRSDGGVAARLIAEKPRDTTQPMTDDSGGLTPSGASYVSGSEHVAEIDLARLETRKFVIDGFRVQSATPTADEDRVLVRGFLRERPGGGTTQFVFSTSELTIAPLRPEAKDQRYVYVRPFNRLGSISGSRIEIVETLPLAGFRSIEQYIAELGAEASLRELDARQRAADYAVGVTRDDWSGAGGVPPGLPVPDWAKDANVQAVGVYESTGGAHGPGRPSSAGPVNVRVKRGARPIVLVLSSYEPVNWQLSVDAGAKIAAVLVGGYHQSEVRGADVRQLDIGRIYAYEIGSEGYRKLELEVARRTGKRIDNFQGRYSGQTFVVGGF